MRSHNHRHRGRVLLTVLPLLAFPTSPVLGSGQPAGRHVAAVAFCRPDVRFLTHGYGSPDDVTVHRGQIYFGDIKAGYLVRVSDGRKHVIRRRLNVPEGIAFTGSSQVAVVEQGLNRIDTLNLKTGRLRVLIDMRNTTGLEGVDAITAVGSDLIIPDSPYGTLYRLHKGNLRWIAGGMSRPTSVVPYQGGFAVADENAKAVWLVQHGRLQRLATLSIPEEVAVVHGMLLSITLGDGALWEVRPRLRRLHWFSAPQGLTPDGGNRLILADSKQNSLYRITLPSACFE
jgi:hypothetical protein